MSSACPSVCLPVHLSISLSQCLCVNCSTNAALHVVLLNFTMSECRGCKNRAGRSSATQIQLFSLDDTALNYEYRNISDLSMTL